MHGEEAIYFLKKDFSRKVFIIKDNVHKKERRILWNGNCREKRHSVVKIIIKHICQRLLTFKLFFRVTFGKRVLFYSLDYFPTFHETWCDAMEFQSKYSKTSLSHQRHDFHLFLWSAVIASLKRHGLPSFSSFLVHFIS